VEPWDKAFLKDHSSHGTLYSSLPIGEDPLVLQASFKEHSSHSTLSSSLPIEEDLIGLQAIKFFTTLSIYKILILFLGGQGVY
jgi:hypothetical protein